MMRRESILKQKPWDVITQVCQFTKGKSLPASLKNGLIEGFIEKGGGKMDLRIMYQGMY